MTTALQTLTTKLAERFDMGDSTGLANVLTDTAFRGQNVSNEQMTALLIVANQYGLNPWTNELYAFPHNGGIVPIVGVDGWSRIMNEHSQYDGIEFTFNKQEDSCTCTIFRKDRSHPIVVTEYLSECQRNTTPWKSHPKRMLRHKTMIQCARLAFGFTGIYDQDEAERIVENQRTDVTPKPTTSATVIEGKAIELITPEQRTQLEQLIEIDATNVSKALAYYGADSIDQLTKTNADHFIKTLNTRIDKNNAKVDQVETGEEIPL